jgi:hypothetical protein
MSNKKPVVMQITIWDVLRRSMDRDYYHANKARRRAQRLASKWGGNFRDYLRGCV